MHQFALLLSLWLAAAASANERLDCITGKYNRYAQAQTAWQRGLTELIAKKAPHYTDVARLYMADQLWRIERRQLEVAYLAEHEPGKLRTGRLLHDWLHLDNDDRQRIASQNDRYVELLHLSEAAKNRPPHPEGEHLRHWMRTQIIQLTGYQTLLDTFQRATAAAEAMPCP